MTRPAGRRFSTRRRSSSLRRTECRGSQLEAAAAGAAVARPPGTREQPQLADRRDGQARRRRRLPRATGGRRPRLGRAADVHRRRARARGDLREPARATPIRTARRRSARGPQLDRRRPPHAHECVARLPRAAGAPPRARGVGRPRSDRGHRPQRLLGRGGGRRARTRARHRRHPRRRGEDRQRRAR